MKARIEIWIMGCVIAVSGIGGCSPDSKSDVDNAGSQISQESKKAGDSMSKTANKTEVQLKNDGVSFKIKEALNSAKDVDSRNLKVDTDGMTVTLHGSVPTAAQKKQTGNIAKDIAGSGFTIKNEVMVGTN